MKALILLPLIATTPALAECVTGADLAAGIKMTVSTGSTSVLTAQPHGVVREDIAYSDGTSGRNLFGKGVHNLQRATVDPESGALVDYSVINTAFPMHASDLFVPTVSSSWSVDTVIRLPYDRYAESQSQVWGAAFDFMVGDCTYTAISGEIRYSSEESTADEGTYYFPDLGVSFMHSFSLNGGEPTLFSITALEPAQ